MIKRRSWDRKGKSSNTCLDDTWERSKVKEEDRWEEIHTSGQLLESVSNDFPFKVPTCSRNQLGNRSVGFSLLASPLRTARRKCGLHVPRYFIEISCCCCCSVTQMFLTLCNTMDCSMPGFPVLHHLSEFT